MASVEERYRELQAEFTRKSQELAELRRKLESGELVDVNEYQEQIRQWARENPEEALAWLGIQPGSEEAGSDTNRSSSVVSGEDLGEIDVEKIPDDVFDPNSDVYKELQRRFGEVGLRRILLAKYGDDLLRHSALGEYFDEMKGRIEEVADFMEQRIRDLENRIERATKYAERAWGEIVAAKDPRVKTVQELQERLRTDPSEWYKVAEAWEAYQQNLLKAEAPGAGGSEPAEAVAQRQHEAQASSEGVGASEPTATAGYVDPWERAVALARRQRETAV